MACILCVEKGLKHYVAFEVLRAKEDGEALRRLLAMERDAALFEKRTLIEQCQIYETEERALSARNAELEASVDRLVREKLDLEARLSDLKADDICRRKHLRVLKRKEASDMECVSVDDMVDRAIYGRL